ncbi:MAG: type I-E CRISPR-associated protein Cas6/Cse3/CasE [Nitrospirota bacterium]
MEEGGKMIASVLRLNRADCKALKLEDAYSVHRIVYSLFPKQDNETRDFLFADKGGDWNCRQILILSKRKPEAPEFGEIISKEIPESFLKKDYYGFEVIVNPIQRNGPSKKTMPIRGIENLHKWFIQRAPALGFEIEPESLQVTRIGVQKFDKDKEGTTFAHTHGSATFIGKLKVIDRGAFIKSFKQGICRAKGFGFGLLQIVPIQK